MKLKVKYRISLTLLLMLFLMLIEMRFDSRSEFSLLDESVENVIFFGADMSSSVHFDNKNKDN